jgi:hypothetical protein
VAGSRVNFAFLSFHILGIGLMMDTKQTPKHVGDLLNSKVVL